MKGMEKIELVINIQKAYYELVLERCKDPVLLNAFKNGTLLQKGHGRIADIDKVLEEMKATRTYDIPFALERVKPIIEADKGESEKTDT